jgi:hypothetical protein
LLERCFSISVLLCFGVPENVKVSKRKIDTNFQFFDMTYEELDRVYDFFDRVYVFTDTFY